MIQRYEIKPITEIWSENSKFDNWLLIETYILEYLQKNKFFSKTKLDDFKKNFKLNYKKIYANEKITKHDVVAFIKTISDSCNEEIKRWLHFGITSTDIVDTSNGMCFKKSNVVIENEILKFLRTLKKFAIKYKNTFQIGRTHGMQAEPTTFGLKFALWYDEMKRHYMRFLVARENIEVGKISGSVGTFANTPVELQDYVCDKLQLISSNISNQTLQRDRHMYYFNVLNGIGVTIEKIATELRHLSRSELSEINEFFAKDQKGSSSMPHKKNPITLENICGLSRLLKGYALTASENVNLWDERDISHSSNERIIFCDAITIICNILSKIDKVINTMYVDENQMLINIKKANNIIFSQTLMLYLIRHTKLPRIEIHAMVQNLVSEAKNSNKDLLEIVNQSNIKDILSKEEIKKIFSLEYHSKEIDKIYQRVFK